MAKKTRNALVHTQLRNKIDQYRIFTDCRFEPWSAPRPGLEPCPSFSTRGNDRLGLRIQPVDATH